MNNTSGTEKINSILTTTKRGELKRGSALIMVMLVVAGITTIIFATQRIALVQFSQSVRQEDNLAATYAAQAGIEDGLARYRFERNSQTERLKKFRLNLTTGNYFNYENASTTHELDENTDIEEGVNGDFDPQNQYYDLTMAFRTNSYGIENNGTPNFSQTNDVLSENESVILTGFRPSTSPYFLRYVLRFDSTCAVSNPDAFVTVQQVKNSGQASQVVAKLSQSIGNVYDSARFANMKIYDTGVTAVSVKISAFYCQVEMAFATTSTVDGSSPSSDPNLAFDGLTTNIISTGYFGSAKRTLIAQINRRTGELIGIFDYLLYAGGSGSTIN